MKKNKTVKKETKKIQKKAAAFKVTYKNEVTAPAKVLTAEGYRRMLLKNKNK